MGKRAKKRKINEHTTAEFHKAVVELVIPNSCVFVHPIFTNKTTVFLKNNTILKLARILKNDT